MIPLSNDNNYRVRLEPKTADGGPARVDGKPVWSRSGDNQAFGVVVDDDGMGALITTPDDDVTRMAELKVTADADLGAGVRTIELVEVLVSGSPPADALGLAFEAVPKVAAEPEEPAPEEPPAGTVEADEHAEGTDE